MSETLRAPFFIRGETRFGDAVTHESRDRGVGFQTPEIDIAELVWPRSQPVPLHDTSVSEIMDFLVECGKAMDLDRNPYLREAIALSATVNNVGSGVTERSYRGIPHSFSRPYMEWMVEQQLGSRFLDGWSPVARIDGTEDLVRAFPARAVHVLAGNGPGGSTTIIRSALTKGTNLLKVASSDLFSMTAMLRTMADVGPNHPVVRSLSAVYWRGGDEAIESRLFLPTNFDKLIAWGGENSMQHIRRYLGPGLELVAFDPKTSFSFIGREAFVDSKTMAEVAELAAADVNLYNQDACVSSRYEYVEATAEQADAYCELLLEALGHERVMGPGKGSGPDRELRDEIDSLRMLEPDYRVFGATDGRGVVIRSEEPVDFYPDRKTVNVVTVPSLKEAIGFANVATQTVGVYPDHRKAEVRDGLVDRGVQRIVPLGHAIDGAHVPHDAMYALHRFVKWVVQEGKPGNAPPNSPVSAEVEAPVVEGAEV